MQHSHSCRDEFRENGVAALPGGLTPKDLDRIAAAFGSMIEIRSGRRQAGLPRELIDWIRVHDVLSGHAKAFLGRSARLVRVIAFDKSPAANWFVPWHQDRSIAVEHQRPTAGFGHWTSKDGYFQVEPPVALLSGMVTLRLHLDDCGEADGPLEVVAGSRVNGRLDRAALAAIIASGRTKICVAARGDIVAMSPLIVHRSRRATAAARRRVLHLEYTGSSLPDGLEWAL